MLRDLLKGDDLGPTFDVFLVRFLRDYARLRRSNHYEAHLKPAKGFLGKKLLKEITRADLDEYAAARSRALGRSGKPLGASTRRKNLMALGTLFKMAVRWGVLANNPAFDLPKPTEPPGMDRFLSREEWENVREGSPPWLRDILTMAVATGMRRKEVTNLRWQDVDLKARVLHVSPDNKTGKPRIIPINETAKGVLASLDKLRDLRTGERLREYVFNDSSGKPFTGKHSREFVGKKATKVMKAAGLKGVTFKTLRDTAGSWMVQRGVPLTRSRRSSGTAAPS